MDEDLGTVRVDVTPAELLRLARGAAAFHRQLETAWCGSLHRGGMSSARYELLEIAAASRSFTIAGASAALGVHRTTIRELIGGLVDQGLMSLEDDPRDGRCRLVVLTPRGERRLAEMTAALSESMASVRMTTDQAAAIRELAASLA